MALNTCPECKCSVSDRAANCPNCGYPIASEDSKIGSNIDAVETRKCGNKRRYNGQYAAPVKKKKHLSAVVAIAVVCIIVVIASCIAVTKHAKEQAAIEARQAYIETLEDFLITSLVGGAQSEEVCNLTKRVWHDTIFEEYDAETAPYTKTDGKFNDDFNKSLRVLYGSDYILDRIISIETNQGEIEEIYKKLTNPTEEFDKCFEEVEALYSAYYRFTKMAISPTGSLQTYSQNFSDLDSEFMEHYEKLKLLIPDE